MTRILILIALLAPGPAFALSCAFTDIPTVYKQLHAAHETYIVVYGEFRRNPVKLSQTRDADILRYHFNGNVMTRQGIGQPFNAPVEVTRSKPQPEFADPGGSIATDLPVLVFLERSGGTYRTNASICGFRQFFEPSPRDLRKVSRCMRGLWCQEARQ